MNHKLILGIESIDVVRGVGKIANGKALWYSDDKCVAGQAGQLYRHHSKVIDFKLKCVQEYQVHGGIPCGVVADESTDFQVGDIAIV